MSESDILDRGATIGGYRIERVLGRGRMGTVYLAQSPDLPRHDTLKVLNSDLVHDPAFRDRFLREADVGAQLSHPNIVAVYRRGATEDGGLWIAMQYVDGIDADTALRQGVLTPTRAVHIVGEIAQALDYAHRNGVVHCDVKPANFLLSGTPDRFERVFLGDFGIAQTSHDDPADSESPVLATVAYSAPEVLTRQPVDGRADIYSLGCSLFRMLTNSVPFPHQGDTAAAVRSHIDAPPPRVTGVRPELSELFDGVVAKAMAKEPADRYQSAQEFASAASAALRAPKRPAPAPPSATQQPAPRRAPIAPPPRQIRPPRAPLASPPPATAPVTPPRPPLASLPPAVAAVTQRHLNSEPEKLAPPNSRPGPQQSAPPSAVIDPAVLVSPRFTTASRGRKLKIVGAVAGCAALIAVIALVATGQDSDSSTLSSTAHSSDITTPITRNADAEARLLKLLPAGYPPEACHAVDPTDEATATITCTVTVDPAAGPATASYLLMPDKAHLEDAFNAIVQKSSAVICPGRIQSPGPWRRNATPQIVAGNVFCGQNASTTTVGWSTNDHTLITVVQASAAGPTLDQLYSWWSTHS
jgi:serine/threonine-protein kinase